MPSKQEYHRAARLIDERLSAIVDTCRYLPKSPSIYLMHWFSAEVGANNSRYPQLKAEFINTREASLIISDATKNIFYFDDSTIDLIVNIQRQLKLTHDELCMAIDNFIVHEIMHKAQFMAEGNHSGLRDAAPNVLAEIDYEADAYAVLILACISMLKKRREDNKIRIGNLERWTLYFNIVRSTLHQIHIFSLMEENENGRTPISQDAYEKKNISLERWGRICAWHMQYHRATKFNISRPFADMQLLFKPHIGFRNQNKAILNNSLNMHWPSTELQTLGENLTSYHLGLSFAGRYGARSAYMYRTQDTNYKRFFEGIFKCSTESSRVLIANFLEQHPEIIGGFRDDGGGHESIRPRPPNDPLGGLSVQTSSPVDRGDSYEFESLSDWIRFEFTPSHPLTSPVVASDSNIEETLALNNSSNLFTRVTADPLQIYAPATVESPSTTEHTLITQAAATTGTIAPTKFIGSS